MQGPRLQATPFFRPWENLDKIFKIRQTNCMDMLGVYRYVFWAKESIGNIILVVRSIFQPQGHAHFQTAGKINVNFNIFSCLLYGHVRYRQLCFWAKKSIGNIIFVVRSLFQPLGHAHFQTVGKLGQNLRIVSYLLYCACQVSRVMVFGTRN